MRSELPQMITHSSLLLSKEILPSFLGFKTGNGMVNIFEGMTDFLSLLTLLKTNNLAGDSILMHSLSSFPKTVDYIKGKAYSSIHTYLDNNPSGAKVVRSNSSISLVTK